VSIKRALNPRTNPNGLLAGASAIAAVVLGVIHHEHIPMATWALAAAAIANLLARTQVTPVSDPRLSGPAAAVGPGQEPGQVEPIEGGPR
jgi:hypothetical protein